MGGKWTNRICQWVAKVLASMTWVRHSRMTLPPAAEALRAELPPLRYVEVLVREGDSVGLWIPESAEALLESFSERAEEDPARVDDRIPYWSELWPAAIGLARWVAGRPDGFWKGKRVLELGCGAGLPGLLAARAGAEVRLTDYDPDAVRLARLNGWALLGRAVSAETLDWRDVGGEPPVDVVLAADVAYEPRNFEPLWAAFERLMGPEGMVSFSEPGRTVARDFIDGLAARGWSMRKTQEVVAFRTQVVEVRLFELRRRDD